MQVSPENVGKADEIVAKYLYNQEKLFVLLKEKYGVPVAGALSEAPVKDEL